jgi:hypothetical protein
MRLSFEFISYGLIKVFMVGGREISCLTCPLALMLVLYLGFGEAG